MFTRDMDKSIEIAGPNHLGNTGNISNCYKLLAALRVLCDWAETDFLEWYKENVLAED